VFEVYLFNVTEPAEMMEDGFKPRVEEVGPFGFVKNHFKYDVHFSEDDSQVRKGEREREGDWNGPLGSTA